MPHEKRNSACRVLNNQTLPGSPASTAAGAAGDGAAPRPAAIAALRGYLVVATDDAVGVYNTTGGRVQPELLFWGGSEVAVATLGVAHQAAPKDAQGANERAGAQVACASSCIATLTTFVPSLFR